MSTHVLFPKGIAEVTRSPNGPVVKDLYKRAKRVERAAKKDVGVRSGALRASISTYDYVSRPWPTFRVGSKLRYALVHHEGSKPHVIKARRPGKRLKFTVSSGATIYRRAVRHPGSKGRKYLSHNLWHAVR